MPVPVPALVQVPTLAEPSVPVPVAQVEVTPRHWMPVMVVKNQTPPRHQHQR